MKKQIKSMDMLHVAKLSWGSCSSAGYDLYSTVDVTITFNARGNTDIQVKVPHVSYGRVGPRSGLAWKQYFDMLVGILCMEIIEM